MKQRAQGIRTVMRIPPIQPYTANQNMSRLFKRFMWDALHPSWGRCLSAFESKLNECFLHTFFGYLWITIPMWFIVVQNRAQTQSSNVYTCRRGPTARLVCVHSMHCTPFLRRPFSSSFKKNRSHLAILLGRRTHKGSHTKPSFSRSSRLFWILFSRWPGDKWPGSRWSSDAGVHMATQ